MHRPLTNHPDYLPDGAFDRRPAMRRFLPRTTMGGTALFLIDVDDQPLPAVAVASKGGNLFPLLGLEMV